MRVRRATCASRSGAARTSPSAMRTHRPRHVARVVPPVRVELAAGAPQVRQPVAQVDHLRLAAGVVGGLVDPIVEVAPAAEDHVGVRERLHVVRARLVLVRVGVRLQELMHREAIALDLAGPVGDLCRGRDHPDPGVAAVSAGAKRRGRRPAPTAAATVIRAPTRPQGVTRGRDCEHRARERRDRGSGRSVQLHRQREPGDPLGRDESDGDRLPCAPGGWSRGARWRPARRPAPPRAARQARRGRRRPRAPPGPPAPRRTAAPAHPAHLRRRGRSPSRATPGPASGSPRARPRSPRPPAPGRAVPPAAGCRTAASPLRRPSRTRRWRGSPRAPASRRGRPPSWRPGRGAPGRRGRRSGARMRSRLPARPAGRRSRGRPRAPVRGRRRCRPRGSRRRGRAARSSSRGSRRPPRAAASRPFRAGHRAGRRGPAGHPSRRGIPDNGNGSHYHRACPRSMIGVVGTRSRKHSEWAEHATAELRRAGHRSGGARAAVIDLMAAQACCLTAQEVFDGLRAEGREVGIASIYRALDLLARLGLVRRLDVGSASGYEPALPERPPPSPRRVRPLRQGVLVRGPRARGGDRPPLAAIGAHGRRARRRAARRVPGLPSPDAPPIRIARWS